MKQLILVRHGETAKNVVDVMHTTGDVEPLNENGVEQMKKTAEKLKEFRLIKVYSSKEARAAQSGEIISKILGVQLETIDGMQERNWGEFSGKSWPEVQKVLGPMSLEERYTYTPPGGESWEQFEKRLIAAVNLIMEKHPGQTIALVSHGGAIRALMPYLLSAPKEESFKHNPDNASLTIFNKEDGALKQAALNDTSHLK